MKKLLLTLAALVVIVFMIYNWFVGIYNTTVVLEEKVNAAWGQVQNVYQRRGDLIPNLVNTVKGYASHERETLEAVIQARANATGISGEALKGVINDPQAFAKFQESQSALGSALSKLMVVVEKYPDLKANQNFLELQSQLEGTENRIAVERRRFNEVVNEYNTYIKQFPRKLVINNFMDAKPKSYFAAEESAQKVPTVEFGK